MASPEKVVIIGNGFDLNLGLETGYDSFLNSPDFEELIENRNTLAVHLKGKHSLKHWIDIENEIGDLSEREDTTIHHHEYSALSGALINYLKKVDTNILRKDSEAYLFLENIMSSPFRDTFLIVDFNYTDSIERILASMGIAENEIQNRVKKVHGALKNGNIIFGVEDGRSFKEEDEYDFLRKSSNRDYGREVDVSSVMIMAREVDIFGSSMGRTDERHFENYFVNRRTRSSPERPQNFNLYYHGNDSLRRLEARISALTFKDKGGFKTNTIFNPIPLVEK